MKNGPLMNKSFDFAKEIVRTYQLLVESKKEYILSKQLLRCGTSIGAMIREAQNAESNLDFIHKLAIAQKECGETIYWLDLMHETGYFPNENYLNLKSAASELARILKSAIVTSKSKLKK